jgi:hypothetical protein
VRHCTLVHTCRVLVATIAMHGGGEGGGAHFQGLRAHSVAKVLAAWIMGGRLQEHFIFKEWVYISDM